MPNTTSAAKRLRSNVKKRMVNRMRKSRIHTSENNLNLEVSSGNKEKAAELLKKCFSELDKAAKIGTIHHNKADRKKQRLVARVAKMA